MRQMLQKVDIVLRSELLIKKLEEEANSYKRTFRGNQHEILDTASDEAKVAKGRTSTKIAELAGTT